MFCFFFFSLFTTLRYDFWYDCNRAHGDGGTEKPFAVLFIEFFLFYSFSFSNRIIFHTAIWEMVNLSYRGTDGNATTTKNPANAYGRLIFDLLFPRINTLCWNTNAYIYTRTRTNAITVNRFFFYISPLRECVFPLKNVFFHKKK